MSPAAIELTAAGDITFLNQYLFQMFQKITLSYAQKLKGSDNKSLPFRSSLQLFGKITLQHP
jgi:hypothetical protein